MPQLHSPPASWSSEPTPDVSGGSSGLWWPGIALALAAFAATGARAVGAGEDAAEVAHLALLGALALTALLPSCYLHLRPVAAAISLLFVLSVCTLPPGQLRGAAAGLLLTATWLLAATATGSTSSATARVKLSSLQVLGLAFSLQVLERGRVLVTETNARSVFILLVLPLIFGVATAQLHRRHGLSALCAALGVVLAAGGITTAATLSLTALAAASLEDRRVAWSLSAALLALTLVWSIPIGTLALLAVLYFYGLSRWPAILMVSAGMLLAVTEVRAWDLTREGVLLGLACLFLVTGTAAARGPWGSLLAAAALGVVGLRFLEPQEALLAPILVASVGCGRYLGQTWLKAQAGWCTMLVACGALVGNYPWHHKSDLSSLLGDGPGWPFALALILAALVTGAALGQRGQRTLLPALLATALVFVAAVPLWQSRTVVLDWPPVTLTAEEPTWESTLPLALRGRRVNVSLDSMMADATALTPGLRFGSLELLESGGGSLASWPLRTGIESAEWSADRTGGPRPQPFSSSVDASGEFFGHRYRARFETSLEEGLQGPFRLRVSLSPEALGAASLTLVHVAAAPVRATEPLTREAR